MINIADLAVLMQHTRRKHPGYFVKFELTDGGLHILAHYWGGKEPGLEMVPWALVVKYTLDDLKAAVALAVERSA